MKTPTGLLLHWLQTLFALAATTLVSVASAVPAPLPLISQGVPAFASDNSNQASLANNANYDDNWRSYRTPSVSQPAWLAYDLSAKRPQQVVLTWYNSSYDYDYILRGGSTYNLFKDYTIEVNAAAGGSVPASGWITKVTVTANEYHSRTAEFDMTGYNWVRLNCTAIAGTASNFDASGNMDVFDARSGAQDTWLFLGDSITAGGMTQSGTTFGQAVHAGDNAYTPSQENGGMAGWKTTDMAAHLSQFLDASPAHFVTLNLGTNDINTYAGDTAAIDTAYTSLVAMANQVIAAGRVPIIPHVPWARNGSIQANAPVLDARIDALCAANPNIIPGPDLYGYFNYNQNLISSDNLHPTNPEGYQAYRNYWAQWALSTIYTPPPDPNAPASKLINISTRSFVGTGGSIQIAGFVITGSQPKTVLLRASGPALIPAPYNVPGTLDDPVLTLFDLTHQIAQNDDWSSDPTHAATIASAVTTAGAFPWATGSKDAAILTTLDPGPYTAQVTGKNGSTGIALVEVYEVGSNATNRLFNLSTRSETQTGANIQIAGFVIQGSQPKKLLVRANGPAISGGPFNVPGTLADPVLTIFKDQTQIAQNDDWDASLAATFSAAGAFAWTPGSKDSAVVLTLSPGAYTAQVAGKNGATGVTLIEVYEVP